MMRPMNKLVKPLALLAFCLLSFLAAKGQTSLSIVTPDDLVVTPDTAACHTDQMFITATVFKTGLDSLPISFNLMMKTPLGTFLLDSSAVGGPAGDSTTLTLVDSFGAARFGGGVNIIVIWPETGFFPPADSVRDTLFVICGSTSADPFGETVNITAYPNPSESGHFFLQHQGAPLHNATLEVRDVAGRLVLRHETFREEIDLSPMPAGVYHLTVWDRQKAPIHLQLVR
jgi:hypothetical protein